jgi:hypothetical protein
MIGAQCLWAGRDLYRATPAVTPRFFRFHSKDRPIQSALMTHKGMWRIYSITWILTGPLTVACQTYIDDDLSINDDQFHSYVDSIFPSELEINTPQNHLLLLLFWCFVKHRYWRETNNSIVWGTGLFQFCHCQLPIYLYQHPTITCIWRIYPSTDSICKSLLYIRSVFESR